MNIVAPDEKRVLAIDPTSKGFGFAVLEGPARLIDWGVKQARGNRNRVCLQQVAKLSAQYEPDFIVVEDLHANGSRRCQRVRELTKKILAVALKHGIRSRSTPRRRVLGFFAPLGSTTKHQMATAIAKRFPELDPRLPPLRKPWMSEDERMSIFDAVALALTFFESARKRSEAPPHHPELGLKPNANEKEEKNPGD